MKHAQTYSTYDHVKDPAKHLQIIIVIFKLAHEFNTYKVTQSFKSQYASRNCLCLLLSDIYIHIYILKDVSASETIKRC